ncbi:hypothetical protein [Bacillus xiapuensis]|uniref:hypothetical protein n=1 Tax=Bacillus xiapuensis TaxID=2014075 RepID=UPI0012FE17D7|nr:hypothetical protein [Bacillus xiapuensis]
MIKMLHWLIFLAPLGNETSFFFGYIPWTTSQPTVDETHVVMLFRFTYVTSAPQSFGEKLNRIKAIKDMNSPSPWPGQNH